ncbi:MAG: hypothetical protein WBV82_09700 [Myxococcaceae bacterium]
MSANPDNAEQREPTLYEEREAAIAELEKRVQRRRFGIRWPTALAAILMAVALLWMQRADVAYFFSSRQPITLGTEDGYHFDRLVTNRYAQIHGVPTTRGAFLTDGDQVFVVVGLQGTPILVKREALPNEDWDPRLPAPQPDQRPFGVRGRLLSEADASKYQQGFALLSSASGVTPQDGKLWLLIAEESPGDDRGGAMLMGFLGIFILANGWFFARDLALRLAARVNR